MCLALPGEIVEVFDGGALRTGRVDPRQDNMLLVTTDGRKAALDLRLHDPRLPDHPDSKVNHAVATIARVWRETATERSAQLVFCDLSVPTLVTSCATIRWCLVSTAACTL